MIIDTHCHYNLEPFYPEWQQHWQQAQICGVTEAVVVGIDFESSQRAIEIAKLQPQLHATVGYHPHFFVEHPEMEIEAAITRLETELDFPEVVGLGETGLDYFRLPADEQERQQHQELQKAGFRRHLQLAKKWQKPAIVHVRDQALPETSVNGNAYWDAAELITSELGGAQAFILHCVSGPLQYIKVLLEQGAYIGIAGNVTYKNAEAIREIVRYTPIDRLLLETDAPFLPPQAHRGHTCEPWMISETATFLEQELKIDRQQLAENTKKIFNFA